MTRVQMIVLLNVARETIRDLEKLRFGNYAPGTEERIRQDTGLRRLRELEDAAGIKAGMLDREAYLLMRDIENTDPNGRVYIGLGQ